MLLTEQTKSLIHIVSSLRSQPLPALPVSLRPLSNNEAGGFFFSFQTEWSINSDNTAFNEKGTEARLLYLGLCWCNNLKIIALLLGLFAA